MKSSLKLITVAVSMALAASANASVINVGGVVWDPDQTAVFPGEVDFTSHGGLLENSVDPTNGIFHVEGRGIVNQINSTTTNQTIFCPGCELTYTFSMDLVAINPVALNIATFSFTNLSVSVFVDNAMNYDGSFANAADGQLWLSLVGNGNLTGTGTDIGTGSDQGSGSALLDVVGGLAMGNFDTNTKLNGADMVFTSSFQPAGFSEIIGYDNQDQPIYAPMLTGTMDLKGNSIPEPGTIALIGAGLLGLGLGRRRISRMV